VVRRSARLAALLCAAAVSVLVMASPAAAHAVLVSSSPADGAVVAHSPARVTATFDEPVGVSAGSLRVFAPDGARADTGGTVHGRTPEEIAVALDRGLGRGTYTVSWHVISADSHPVQGAFTFSVGAPSSTVVTPASLRPPASRLVGITFGVVRWLAFCCFAILSGAVTFLIVCWPAGATRPAVLRLTMTAWAGLAASVLAAVLLQGVYGAGQSIGHLFWPNVLHATLYSRYGRAIGMRLLLVIVALFMFTITLASLPDKSRRERTTAVVAWGLLTAALAATWGVADHAGTGFQVALAVPADIVHLSAMATWLGGLAMLVTIVLRQSRPRPPGALRGAVKRGDRLATADAAQAVIRFSLLALGCVAAIVVTGTYMAWRNVGTLGALAGTTYGRLLLAKIAGLCLLIALGYLARRRIADGLQAPVAAVRAAEMVTAGAPARVKSGAGAPARRVKGAASAPQDHCSTGHRDRAARDRARSNGQPGQKNGQPGQKQAPAAVRDRGGRPDGARPDGARPDGARPDVERMGVTLRKLRWSVAAETVIAATVLAVTAVLVNSPTARESYFPPATANASFNTGGPGGRGNISIIVTPAGLGPNKFRIVVTGSGGKPYRPQQFQASLWMPARKIGPLAVRTARDGPGRYLAGPAVISTAGQWQLLVTIRSDAFDEAAIALPFSIH
jgi:copper transport protein